MMMGSSIGEPNSSRKMGSSIGEPSSNRTIGATIIGEPNSNRKMGSSIGEPNNYRKMGSSIGEPDSNMKMGDSIVDPSSNRKMWTSFDEPNSNMKIGASIGEPNGNRTIGASKGEPNGNRKMGASIGEPNSNKKMGASIVAPNSNRNRGPSIGEPNSKGKIGSSIGEPDSNSQQEIKVDEDAECGLGKCSPSCLQTFNTPYVLVVCMCLYVFSQGFIVAGVHNINTASYERRFDLTSEKTGWITGANHISSAIVGLVAGLYGRRHKPRWLAAGAFSTALGFVCMGLPHFTTGLYHWGQGDDRVCRREGGDPGCEAVSEAGLSNYFYLLVLGSCLNGVSGGTIMTVGMSLIDDCFPAVTAPLFNGMVLASLYLGYGAGFVAGGQALNLYVDFDKVPRDKWLLTPEDPRWVGAWWLCFFCAAAVLVVFTFIFCLFGKEILVPDKPKWRQGRHDELRQHSTYESTPMTLRRYVTTLCHVTRNPTVVCLCLGYACTFGLIQGLASFIVKIIQNQFQTTAAWAALLSGVVLLTGMILGFFLGGAFTKKAQLAVRGCLRMTLLMQAIGSVLTLAFLVDCDQVKTVGWNEHYADSALSGTGPVFDSPCNLGCNCRLDLFEPVCDSSGLRYFSPCFAGCETVDPTTNKVYSNCTCISDVTQNATVTFAACPQGCDLVYGLLLTLFFCVFLLCKIYISLQTAVIRINNNNKTFALGILGLITRLAGALPGPVVIGAIIDVTCVVWGETCGDRTSCWIYDNASLGRNVSIASVSISGGATLFYLLAYICYRPGDQPPTDDTHNHRQPSDEITSISTKSDDMHSVKVSSGRSMVPVQAGSCDNGGFSLTNLEESCFKDHALENGFPDACNNRSFVTKL